MQIDLSLRGSLGPLGVRLLPEPSVRVTAHRGENRQEGRIQEKGLSPSNFYRHQERSVTRTLEPGKGFCFSLHSSAYWPGGHLRNSSSCLSVCSLKGRLNPALFLQTTDHSPLVSCPSSLPCPPAGGRPEMPCGGLSCSSEPVGLPPAQKRKECLPSTRASLYALPSSRRFFPDLPAQFAPTVLLICNGYFLARLC